ncbi:MAG: hypothetical protein B7Z75_07335 [Acidocella sp. 20-57-95]|nr:MAG: hypothetical protein B7Z75_07335 [Acidocella sp. 20-57-95]OYV51893.1 MAG: hypothetical protein B7X10_00420 [Burkholderiales bacterium 21-58-4]HQT63512.1 hypothetical protein [Acidocella sp.]HQU05410.1 hypothetical protein [Acidocella sp.]
MADTFKLGPFSVATQQASYRVQAPNSSPRELLIVPLGEASGKLLELVAQPPYRNAKFVPYTPSGEPWRKTIDERNLDLVVMVGFVGENLAQVIAIGETCIARKVKISSILIHKDASEIVALSSALRSMRPWSQTLAVVSDADYVPGLLHALGA